LVGGRKKTAAAAVAAATAAAGRDVQIGNLADQNGNDGSACREA